MHDVAIIGGGPAGLSAALMLGRCCRDVVLFDAGRPRNAVSRGLHGFLTRDGISPWQLRDLARAELATYSSVHVRDIEVLTVRRQTDRFTLTTKDRGETITRFLLLATGRNDAVPDLPGVADLYGRGVYHCPLCDGWEHRNEPLAVFGRGDEACETALALLTWSRRVAVFAEGEDAFSLAARQQLARNSITLVDSPIARLNAGADGMLESIQLTNGDVRACRAFFFVASTPQKSPFAEVLGCAIGEAGGVVCDGHAATNVPGLFVAGNVRCGSHLAITAAAEGIEAAIAINQSLRARELA